MKIEEGDFEYEHSEASDNSYSTYFAELDSDSLDSERGKEESEEVEDIDTFSERFFNLNTSKTRRESQGSLTRKQLKALELNHARTTFNPNSSVVDKW